jgi:hypothetical protein
MHPAKYLARILLTYLFIPNYPVTKILKTYAIGVIGSYWN